MRKAILIGVSKYENCDNLPGCLNDVNALNEILLKTNEFDEVKAFKEDVYSDDLKNNLSQLFSDWKGEQIDELFFYFSGHGSFDNNEFFYLLSDFSEDKKRQTTLQNLEIDKMIKSLSPTLVTKVIDACQSGVSYIKSNGNSVEKYYHKTLEGFNKCYFLHSSMTNQYSYIDSNLSDFTRSFIGALKNRQKQYIRYKDIIDYISDEFAKSTEQTPFFVTQADYTEIFTSTSDKLNDVLAKYIISENVIEKKDVEEIKYNSYIDKIKKDAELYSSQNEVIELFSELKNLLENKTLEGELKELYEIKVTFEQYLGDLPRRYEIGKWIEDNKNNYFVEATYEQTPYEEEIRPMGLSISDLLSGSRVVTKHRNSLKGFDLTIDNIPFKSITIDFIPTYPNITQYATIVTFLISKKDIKVFHGFTNYIEKDWAKKRISNNFKWQSSDFIIKNKDDIFSFFDKLFNDSIITISNILKKRYDVNE